MTRNRWITPAAAPPTDFYCRRLLIPKAVDWLALVNGALLDLTYSYNFEQVEGISPDDTAAAFLQMYDTYMAGDYCMLGMILPHVRNSIPSWALPCDGGTYLKADYPDLYDVLESALIVDATHFKTPDINHARMIRGTITPSAYGTVGGSDSITLSSANMPAHSHSEITAIAAVGAAITGVPVPSAIPGVGITGSAGAGTAFNAIPGHIKTGFVIVAKNGP